MKKNYEKIYKKLIVYLIGFWALFYFPWKHITVPEEAPVLFGWWYITIILLVLAGLNKTWKIVEKGIEEKNKKTKEK